MGMIMFSSIFNVIFVLKGQTSTKLAQIPMITDSRANLNPLDDVSREKKAHKNERFGAKPRSELDERAFPLWPDL
jgi:hypothetical protein